ncbi:hypothetical protein WAE61_06910 [Comamonadaceae bacterium PP-2]
MKKYIATVLAFSCLATSIHAFAQPKTSQYRVTLVDAKSGSSISPETVRFEVDEEEHTPNRDGHIVSVSLVSPPLQTFKITARPEGGYVPRTVVLTPEGINSKRTKTVAIERRPTQFNLPYLQSGAQRFERGQIDEGFALFEAAAFSDRNRPQMDEVTDYDVLFRWNYARGLQQTCLELGYDTCGKAAERLAIVDADFANEVNARRYRARRVTHDMVKTALRDLAAKDFKARYAKGQSAFRDKQHDTAIEVWEELLKQPELLSAVQLTKYQVESDISFAKTRKAEAAARDIQ